MHRPTKFQADIWVAQISFEDDELIHCIVMRSSDIHLNVISLEIHQLLIAKISFKITYTKFNSNLPGINELTSDALEILVNTGSGNGLLPDGTKPLPEPMLTYHQ